MAAFLDTIRHYFALFRLKICYCSWPPNNWAKRAFSGNFCSSPVAVGCGGIGPDRPRKGPEKVPICPKKARFARKDSSEGIYFKKEKGSQAQTFGSGYFRVGWGVFHVKGWGPKSSACPSKPRETKLFGRDRVFPEFCRDIPGVPGKFEKKKFVFNSSFPINLGKGMRRSTFQ